MLLDWINVTVYTVTDLLWQITVHPPPVKATSQTYAPTAPSTENQSQILARAEESFSSALTVLKNPMPQLPQKFTKVIKSVPPSLFALIIGINKYQDPNVRNLRGAVADADTVYQFFTSKAHVSKDRIINLRDNEATRHGIIQALKALADNPDISLKDPILIYYAGHGGTCKAPDGWAVGNTSGEIQMLVPYDFVQQGSGDLRGQGVFDFVISHILTDIARKKSDNITVIFDCCHSGSGTRGISNDETFAVRGIKLSPNYTIPRVALKDASEGAARSSSIAKGHELNGLRSHILLSACKQGQYAREQHGHGAFTSALIELFEREGLDKLTYTEAIKRLPDLSLQNPQCEGIHRNRVLFNGQVSGIHHVLYRVTSQSSMQYNIEAGHAHGITEKAQFAVYSDRNMTNLLGIVIADTVNAFNTLCFSASGHPPSPFSLTQSAYATQIQVGEGQEILIYIELKDEFLDLFTLLAQDLSRPDFSKRSLRLVNSVNANPHLVLGITQDGFVSFKITDRVCKQSGLEYMPYYNIRPSQSQHLLSILYAAVDFYWNLYHSSKDVAKLSQHVTLECFKLKSSDELHPELAKALVPVGKNLISKERGQITIDINVDADEEYSYGYKITNYSTQTLYASLFYFSASSLEIASYNLHYTASDDHVEPSIQPNSSLTIGYGDSGTVPYTYSLDQGQNVDVGFLKLYISTKYIDHSTIVQTSPFHGDRKSNCQTPRPKNFWDTIMVPIIQQAKKKNRS